MNQRRNTDVESTLVFRRRFNFQIRNLFYGISTSTLDVVTKLWQRWASTSKWHRKGFEFKSWINVELQTWILRLYFYVDSTFKFKAFSTPHQRRCSQHCHNVICFILVYVIHGIHVVFIILTFNMPLITLSVTAILYISCNNGVTMSVHMITRIKDGNGSVGQYFGWVTWVMRQCQWPDPWW